MVAPLQPLRRARTKAADMTKKLKNMAKADERTIKSIVEESGVYIKTYQAWPDYALPTLVSAIALADTLGYEIVLRRKNDDR